MSFQYNFNKVLFVCLICCSIGFSHTQNVQNDINKSLKKLPFCEQNILSEDKKRLILVSTLDGKISALNIDNGGSESWNVQTGPGAMLSSSIHTLELTNDGKWVRMIPSLSGGLYKFNGDHIEAIPITAENLLRSSFKFSNDVVMSGGKESRVYGIEAGTGRLLYECSISGCDNRTELEATGDVVVLRRYTQTVRAVEPLTGIERWNFSVGQHEVKVEAGLHAGCYSHQTQFSDVQLKVIVPQGLVCAISTSQPGKVLWTHKFDSPVVSVWKLGGDAVEEVDLFGGIQPPLGPDEQPLPSSPSLYVGMHKKQLYIQESVMMQQKLDELANSLNHHLLANERRYPQIPWNPVPVTGTVLGLPSPDDVLTAESAHEESNQTTALSVLYASEYVNGNGYYLYSDKEPAKEGISLCSANKTKDNSTEEEIPVIESPDDNDQIIVPQIFVTSLWFWWKEVFLISVTTAVLLNILIQRRLSHGGQFPTSQMVLMKQTLKSYSSRDSGHESTTTSDSASSVRTADNYESRFLTDFQPELCLGKGGFGVVFEARNKIDDCHYAIKRIPLPNSEESRERVMREVKALAKLDHQNIVRYFNAWLECPPPGWQETQDQLWRNTRQAVSSNGEAFTVDLTGQVTPDSERSCGHVINRNHLKPLSVWRQPDWLSQSSSLPSKPQPADDDNDSFIVFGSPSRDASEAVTENLEEIEVEDDVKLDSAITVGSETSVDTNTEVSELDRTSSQRRPKSLKLTELSTCTAGFSSSRMFLFIQMQLCKKESLKDWLKDNTVNRSRPAVINIFSQIVQAVEYVHMQGLIHRDLKPSNIFFSPDGQVKVGDFGLVTAMAESPVDSQSMWVGAGAGVNEWTDERHTARVGTQLYMSPEQVSGKAYSYKVDIYSLGVILFELLVAFNTQMERIHTLTNLRANKYPDQFPSQFTQEYELLKCMLSHLPEERPTTFGIRARPPLNHDAARAAALSEWHLELPSRRRSSTSFSHSSSHSGSLDS